MPDRQTDYDVVIAGGGPAGTSAAIHLAQHNARVLLVEQKVFPRHKLCGEFISPECKQHFERLGVAEQMNEAGPSLLQKTIFYSRHGQSVQIPSNWFGSTPALGLSRAVMDQNLLERAKQVGVDVIENATVSNTLRESEHVCGVQLKKNGKEIERTASLTIDATGRSRVLTRKVSGHRTARSKWVAFKVHLTNTRVAPGVCEIYFYRGGYGGLSTVENDTSNLCFIVSAADVRRFNSDAEIVMRERVMKNPRAAETVKEATANSEWLSVALENFGRQRPSPAPGLLAIGDSAAFIDPFTGSGMLMALESGELAAEAFVRYRNKFDQRSWFEEIAIAYSEEYQRRFRRRLITSGILRRLAFKPRLADAGIRITAASDLLRNRIARATRPRNKISQVR